MNAHVDPAELVPANATLPPLTEWICEAPMEIPRNMLRALNAATKETITEQVLGIRWTYRSFFERSIIRGLKQREYVVLSAIISRTLSYGRFSEEIPISQFINGIRDVKTGDLKLDERGNPVFEGTGLDKNTIRAAVGKLSRMGLISVFSVPTKGTKDTYAFSMVSLRTIYAATCDMFPEDEEGIRQALGSKKLYHLAIFRDAASELEERCANLFPGGLASIKQVQCQAAGELREMQRDVQADPAYANRQKFTLTK